jgi:hypothetical protein
MLKSCSVYWCAQYRCAHENGGRPAVHRQLLANQFEVGCRDNDVAQLLVNAPLSAKLAEIRRWHMQDRSWRNIGYHWLIDFDGQRAA